jgi:hypothetical protein
MLDYYLCKRRAHGMDTIDGFLLLVLVTQPHIWIHKTLGVYLATFSMALLCSIVIVITQNNHLTQPKGVDFIADILAQVHTVVDGKLGPGTQLLPPLPSGSPGTAIAHSNGGILCDRVRSACAHGAVQCTGSDGCRAR